MNLKPLYDRVIVKADEAEEKTASGLILADTAKEKPTARQGRRRRRWQVGRGRREAHPARRQGRRHRHLQQVRRDRGQEGYEEFLILRDTDIYAIVVE